jgi:hypothetical protein
MFGALVFLYRVELHMQFSSGGTTVVYQSQQKLYIGLLSYETKKLYLVDHGERLRKVILH